MEYGWSEDKRLLTIEDRGLDFRDAHHLFDGRAVFSYPSTRNDEDRTVSVASLAGRLIAVVWMDRADLRRIISMRRARHAEERKYHELFGKGADGNE